MRRLLSTFLVSGTFTLIGTVAGNSLAQQDAPALLTATNAALGLGINPPKSVVMHGSIDWTAGSTHASGTIVLSSSSDGGSSEAWNLPSLNQKVTRSSPLRGRKCSVADGSGKQSEQKDLNCMRVGAWFSPWQAFQLAENSLATAVVSTTGADSTSSLDRITFTPSLGTRPGKTMPEKIKAELGKPTLNVLVNSTTHLPIELQFQQFLPNDSSQSFPVRVVFSDYRREGSLLIPHHLQKYVQRTLQADVVINSVEVQ